VPRGGEASVLSREVRLAVSLAADDSISAASAADSLPADTAAVRAPGSAPVAEQPSVARPRDAAAKPPGFFSTPGWVMMRSAVVPGWGQWNNRQWLKALVIGSVEWGMAYRIYDDNRALDDLEREAIAAREAGDLERANEVTLRYNDRLDTMVSRQWLLAGVIAYSLLDAYVDAHFRDFEIEFETDPALPGGEPQGSGVRARLRWSF
jgi:hypothetical protein